MCFQRGPKQTCNAKQRPALALLGGFGHCVKVEPSRARLGGVRSFSASFLVIRKCGKLSHLAKISGVLHRDFCKKRLGSERHGKLTRCRKAAKTLSALGVTGLRKRNHFVKDALLLVCVKMLLVVSQGSTATAREDLSKLGRRLDRASWIRTFAHLFEMREGFKNNFISIKHV